MFKWLWKGAPPTQAKANGDGLWGGRRAVVMSLPCGDNDVPCYSRFTLGKNVETPKARVTPALRRRWKEKGDWLPLSCGKTTKLL